MKQLHKLFVVRNSEIFRNLVAFIEQNATPMAKEGRFLAVEIREHKAKRSGQANRRYWALLRFISENAWVGGKTYSDDVWHSEFARRFIGCEESPSGHEVPISTTTLDVGEFNAYMESIEKYASEVLGLEMEHWI